MQKGEAIAGPRKVQPVIQLFEGVALHLGRAAGGFQEGEEIQAVAAQHEQHQNQLGDQQGRDHGEDLPLADPGRQTDEDRDHHRIEGVVEARHADHQHRQQDERIPEEGAQAGGSGVASDHQCETEAQGHAERQGQAVVEIEPFLEIGRHDGGQRSDDREPGRDAEPPQGPIVSAGHGAQACDIEQVDENERTGRQPCSKPADRLIGRVETREIEPVARLRIAELGVEAEAVALDEALGSAQQEQMVFGQIGRLGQPHLEVADEQEQGDHADAEEHRLPTRRRRLQGLQCTSDKRRSGEHPRFHHPHAGAEIAHGFALLNNCQGALSARARPDASFWTCPRCARPHGAACP